MTTTTPVLKRNECRLKIGPVENGGMVLRFNVAACRYIEEVIGKSLPSFIVGMQEEAQGGKTTATLSLLVAAGLQYLPEYEDRTRKIDRDLVGNEKTVPNLRAIDPLLDTMGDFDEPQSLAEMMIELMRALSATLRQFSAEKPAKVEGAPVPLGASTSA